jgi:hypothetical protein
MRHLLDYNAKRQRLFSDFLQVLLICLTLFSTLASVAFTYLDINGYLADSKGLTPIQQMQTGYGLGALNLLLPLAVSIFRAMIAALTPQSKYAILKSSAVKVESEIYMYRTKTGKYNPRRAKQAMKKDKDNNGDNNDNAQKEAAAQDVAFQPSKVLANAMDTLWAEISASDITKGALIAPPLYTDPLDSINKVLRSNTPEQRQLTEALRPPNSNSLLNLVSGDPLTKTMDGAYKYLSSCFTALGRRLRPKSSLTSENLGTNKSGKARKVHVSADDGAKGRDGDGDGDDGAGMWRQALTLAEIGRNRSARWLTHKSWWWRRPRSR